MGNLMKYVDENGVEHTINFSEANINDNAISANSAWSSNKTNSEIGSQINNALAKHQFISASTKSNQVNNVSFEVSSTKGSGKMWISNRATTDSSYIQGQFTFQVYSNGTVAYKQYGTDIISSVTFNATTKMVTVTLTLTAYFQVQGEFVPSIES